MPDYIKTLLPPEVYQHYCYDIEKMKALQAETVGFKAPDVVGKIAPEITPGKYTFKDIQTKPGLKELMIPLMYEKFFRQAGPPLGGTFSEFEIVPTWQYYNALPQLQATLKYKGKAKVDDQGFLDWKSWEGGIPFPRPFGSDRMKAMQFIYNTEMTHRGADGLIAPAASKGWNKKFDPISGSIAHMLIFTIAGRVTDEPLGWLDERAKSLGEFQIRGGPMVQPRDMYGNVTLIVSTLDPNESNKMYAYAAMLRRVRKMSGTDSQDTVVGANVIFDDSGGFNRKLSPDQFPYEYKILADREYLVPAYLVPGDTFYLTSKELEFRNLKMVRRPMIVVELIQKDPAYVYGRTVLYFDKETFDLFLNESYDQKGRLFRVAFNFAWSFNPATGIRNPAYLPSYNMQVEQTAVNWSPGIVPINYWTRGDFSLSKLQHFTK
ncbi:MAG: DUF1329 domain-containing protein [Desulfatitalea sp.]|nr:DUF1329 domain-containing protein [Desulfatitalea sp.]